MEEVLKKCELLNKVGSKPNLLLLGSSKMTEFRLSVIDLCKKQGIKNVESKDFTTCNVNGDMLEVFEIKDNADFCEVYSVNQTSIIEDYTGIDAKYKLKAEIEKMN